MPIVNMKLKLFNRINLFLAGKLFSYILLISFIVGCREKNINLSQVQSADNKEILVYFNEIGFNEKNILKKWETDIIVSVFGKYDENDIQSIDEFIGIFNELSNDIKMKRNDNKGNVTINFGEDKSFNPKGYVGLCSKKGQFFFSNEITSAKILISPIIGAKQRRKTIHHEMLHAIGLKDSRKSYVSYSMLGVNVFNSIDDYENQTQDIQSSELDKWAIQILYNKDIRPGLRKDDFNKQINI